jgi:hypothetical protein
MTVNEGSMKELAIKYKFTTGKWLITVPWSEADEVWKKLVNALLEGKFADDLGVRYIKAYGRCHPNKNNPHCIDQSITTMLVGTQDWKSEAKTMEVAKVIRSLGISQEMNYKPDLYSNLKIFHFNIFNLRPSIYHC